MRVEIAINPDQREPKLVLITAEETPQLRALAQALTNQLGGASMDGASAGDSSGSGASVQAANARQINAFDGHEVVRIREEDLLRVYAEQQRVYAQTADGVYLLHARLYEMEQQLDPAVFVRISNAELVNSRRIVRLDASITGTIGVLLEGGVKTFASRRHVRHIKQFFGL